MANDRGSSFKEKLSRGEEELKALLDIAKSDHTPELKECILQAKKSIEMLLYQYVSRGCTENGRVYDAFPKLVNQYDPDSMKNLDLKIKVLSEIVKQGPECDYTNIDGFDDILENKYPPGMKEITFDR